VARTAVVAGTATAVSNRVSRRQAGRWADQEQQQAAQQPPPPAYPPQYQQPAYQEPPPPPPAPAPVQAAPAEEDMDSKLLQLRQLGELKTQGILSEAEFEAQKRKILGA
jgi:Short C-terminal domain